MSSGTDRGFDPDLRMCDRQIPEVATSREDLRRRKRATLRLVRPSTQSHDCRSSRDNADRELAVKASLT